MYAEIQSIWILWALQVSHDDPWAHTRLLHMCSVCVCVRIHTPTPTYTPTRVKNREDTDNTHISPSVKNNSSRGHRDSARLLGESCWQKKLRGHSGKKFARKSRNSWRLNVWGCGCIGTVDSGPKCAQSWNQIQTLKNCISCHIYCAHFCTPLQQIVEDICTVPNRESRYPRTFRINFSEGSGPP